MKGKKEITIGIVVLGAIAVAVWGINFLMGENILLSSKVVYAIYPRTDGLKQASPIVINGSNVGQVQKIYFHPDQSGTIVTKLIITEKDFIIPKNSLAKLISSDFLGSKAIELQIGDSKEELENGDTLTTEIQKSLTDEVNQQLLPLKNKAEELLSSVDSVANIVTAVLNKNTQKNVSGAFESLRNAIVALESTSKQLNTLMSKESVKISSITENIDDVTSVFSDRKSSLDSTLKNLATVSQSLADSDLNETLKSAQETMENLSNIMKTVDDGEGSLGQLLHNDTLYYNLESASKSLDALLQDMQEHPKRYVHFSVFGKSDK